VDVFSFFFTIIRIMKTRPSNKPNFSRPLHSPSVFIKGFTLIELLVVIAIIGVLSAVVLASLNTARGKGSDAAIKSNLANMRAQAEIYYDDPLRGNGTYGNGGVSCTTGVFSDTIIQSAISSANSAGYGGAMGTTYKCWSTATAYAVMVDLKTGAGGTSGAAWCVDNNGNSRLAPGGPVSMIAASCP
jgi:prepilin-type N-terminal cleavage/methylation domain-containing protein